jgi:integrase
MRLTEITIRNLAAPAAGQATYWDASLPGFGLRLSQGGARSFVVVHSETRTRQTIGRYPIISLADARSEARRLMAEITLGLNKPPTVTFETALDEFLLSSEKRNRPRTARDYRRLLTRHFLAPLGTKQLGDITALSIRRIIDNLLSTPSECSHAFAAIKIFFRWAARGGLVQANPCERLSSPTKPLPRERVLTDDELCRVYLAARSGGYQFGTALQLLILTGQRRTEIGSLRWDWIDTEKRTITLPSAATKNKRTHTFPYGQMTADILAAVPRLGPHVFPGNRGPDVAITGWSNFKAKFDKTCRIAPWTLHDLRRTFATGLAALGVRLEVTEKLLNHVSGSLGGIVGVYQRHSFQDEMRAANVLWESHIASLLKSATLDPAGVSR